MDTEELRFFRQVYETGSINKASRQLFITPQGLSRVIQHLEEELEASLFTRTANGMVPTESGRFLYENSLLLLEQFDELTVGLRQIRDRERKLKIGFACGVLHVFPLQKLEEYIQHSKIMLQWEESSNQEILHQVQQGSMDMGLVIGQTADTGLWSFELFSRKMNVIVYEGHPFYGRTSLSVGELKEERLITLNEKYYSYHSLLQRCRDFGFTPNIVARTMESQIIYKFCQQKIGLGIDADIHQNRMRMEGLCLVGLHDSLPWKVSMIIRKDRKKEPVLWRLAELLQLSSEL